MLLDTSGLMCLFDRRDTRHATAVSQYESAISRLSHNYVLTEFISLSLARRVPRIESLQFIEFIQGSGEIEVVWVDRDLHYRALRFLSQREDKAWSLCDAVSFVVMRDRGLLAALTTDHDFEQAGFIRLLDQ